MASDMDNPVQAAGAARGGGAPAAGTASQFNPLRGCLSVDCAHPGLPPSLRSGLHGVIHIERHPASGCKDEALHKTIPRAVYIAISGSCFFERERVNFHQDGDKFLSGRKFIFVKEKIYFYQGENLRASRKKFIATGIKEEILNKIRDTEKND
ncbi:MAG: hypothetical protein LBK22_06485 [Tannerella sp.]|jgi:hypothetical protein|nr:hypothetical protein [Tannerella sp.]